jgi:peptidyl-prolyl cis-trans isomerase C
MSDCKLPVVRPLAAALIVGLSLALAPFGAAAQDATASAVAPETVVATVGEDSITEADLSFAAEDLAQELANIPEADRKAFLVTVLIDMKVMAQAARKEQMDQTDVFKRRLQYLEERALRRAYFAEKISTSVTPEAVQAAYDAYVSTFVATEEVHAAHILVSTEEDAKAIKAEIDAGADFATLASTKSIDPSAAQNGGDLGFFSKGMMVKPFEDAAFALTDGQVSEPVQSDFGWHVIKLIERRQSAPPTMEQIGSQLQQQVLFKSFDDAVAALKTGVAISIPDPALAAAVATQSEPAPQ